MFTHRSPTFALVAVDFVFVDLLAIARALLIATACLLAVLQFVNASNLAVPNSLLSLWAARLLRPTLARFT